MSKQGERAAAADGGERKNSMEGWRDEMRRGGGRERGRRGSELMDGGAEVRVPAAPSGTSSHWTLVVQQEAEASTCTSCSTKSAQRQNSEPIKTQIIYFIRFFSLSPPSAITVIRGFYSLDLVAGLNGHFQRVFQTRTLAPECRSKSK